MSKSVYKSPEGRSVIESFYRKVLTEYSSLCFEQLFIDTESTRTHVLRFGEISKPPLIMLHGSASNSAVWLGIVKDFTDHFCVYCVDIPGEPGLSDPIRFSFKTDVPHKWIRSLLDNLGIKKSSFLTISLGSWYALNFAIHNPERVEKLSIITIPGIVPAKTGFIFKAVFFMMLGKTGQKLLSKEIFYKADVPPQVLEFQMLVSKHFNPVMETIPVFSDAELKRVSVPVQYFGGDHDALLDSVKTGERLKKLLPVSEINILKDTGHAIIDQFLNAKSFLISK